MQDGFELIEAALTGSTTVLFQADAWYDGELIATISQASDDSALSILSGTVDVDATRSILTTASTVIGSPDDSALPTGYDSPLACYGSELNIRAAIDTGSDPRFFSLGWLRIDDYDTTEWVQQYYRDDEFEPTWISRGIKTANGLSDRWVTLDDADYLAPAKPASLASAKAEMVLVVDGLVPIADWTDVTDKPIPQSFTYATKRSATVQSLADLLDCVAYMNPDGALDLRAKDPGTAPVWHVAVGSDGVDAPLLQWARKGDRSGISNGVLCTGQAPDGTPISGQALESKGPLRWDGPFGRVPIQYEDSALATNADCKAGATTTLAQTSKQRTVTIPVTLPWNPALEAMDVIELALPDRTLTGPVVAMSRPLAQGPMTAEVAIARDALWGLAAGS